MGGRPSEVVRQLSGFPVWHQQHERGQLDGRTNLDNSVFPFFLIFRHFLGFTKCSLTFSSLICKNIISVIPHLFKTMKVHII